MELSCEYVYTGMRSFCNFYRNETEIYSTFSKWKPTFSFTYAAFEFRYKIVKGLLLALTND